MGLRGYHTIVLLCVLRLCFSFLSIQPDRRFASVLYRGISSCERKKGHASTSFTTLIGRAEKDGGSGSDAKEDEDRINKIMDTFLSSGEGYIDLTDGNKGCLKKVLKEGAIKHGHPQKGQTVKLHYTINIIGQDEPLHSTLENNNPLRFTLGREPSDMILGWDIALQTMYKGEYCNVICSPPYAYGEQGVAPKIPPQAVLQCYLELVDWVDLERQYGVISSEEEEEALRAQWRADAAAGGDSPLAREMGMSKQVEKFTDVEFVTEEDMEEGRGGGNGAKRNADAGSAGAADTGRDKTVTIVDIDDPRNINPNQMAEGESPRGFAWEEKASYLELRVPVPRSVGGAGVEVAIRPRRLKVAVPAVGIALEDELEGTIDVDGSYWYLDDDSTEGQTSVKVFLEKKKPKRIWATVFKSKNTTTEGDAVKTEEVEEE